MEQDNHGLKIWDDKGVLILEVGPHVIREAPKFAEKIGIVAASWAQAEVNLNCLLALLLDTTPEEAAKELKKQGSAARATDRARSIAKDTLSGAELTSVMNALGELDQVRLRRNRVQHDVWAKKGGDSLRMFAVHSNQYLAFTVQMMAVAGPETGDGLDIDEIINTAMNFSASLSSSYTIEDLQNIALDVDAVSRSLLQSMFSLIMLRAANSGTSIS